MSTPEERRAQRERKRRRKTLGDKAPRRPRKENKTVADLSAKEVAYIEEYPKDLNGLQAAIRAGYSAKGAGQVSGRLQRDPVIKAELARIIALRTKANEVTVERVLQELKAMAFTNMSDFIKVSSNGTPTIDLSELTPEMAASMSEFKINKDGDLVLKLHDKGGALSQLGRYLKMFTDVVEVKDPIGDRLQRARQRREKK